MLYKEKDKLRLLKNRRIDSNKCWNWTGRINRYGYGLMSVTISKNNTISKETHRYAYELFNNVSLSKTEIIHHKCRNRKCFNPKHLEKTTILNNNLETYKDWKLFCEENKELINEYNILIEKIKTKYNNWFKK